MADKRFGLVIVNWNVRDYLDNCLKSLAKWQVAPACHIVVVDNGSVDGSVQMIKQKYPSQELIEAGENLGFAKANNLGAKALDTEYLILINPDTEIIDDFTSKIESFFALNPKAAVVGGKLINNDNSIQASVRTFPKLWPAILDSLKLLKRFPKLGGKYLQTSFDYSAKQPVDQVMGAFMIIKSSVWQELGGFDEKYKLWFEEVDFCKRVKDAGYEIWYSPEFKLRHTGARSFVQLLHTAKHKLYSASLLRYFSKFHSKLSFNILKFFVWIGALESYLLDYAKSLVKIK